MQVDRCLRALWRTGEEHVGACPEVGDNSAKAGLIPHTVYGPKPSGAFGGACVGLASWWGNGLPRRRSVAGLRGWSATRGLRYGPDSYGRQQLGILGMGESLTQQRRVGDEGLRVVKP